MRNRWEPEWKPYVSVAERQRAAARDAEELAQKGTVLRPIRIKSSTIASSFWGKAWCKNLEVYADWANRIPRGRSYARNGSIVDLQITRGSIQALVRGSSLYEIDISIAPLDTQRWKAIRTECASQVGSLLDLMRGKLPPAVLQHLTDPKKGMFPNPKELTLRCSCPDYAKMCKHIAATLYGVGHLLDTEPELFFEMRGVAQVDLVSEALKAQNSDDLMGLNQQSNLGDEDLSALFGIELASVSPSHSHATDAPTRGGKRRKKPSSRAIRKSKSLETGALAPPQIPQSSNGSRRAKRTSSKPTPLPSPRVTSPSTAKKPSVKKTTDKKANESKAPVKRASVKKATAKKATAKKATSKKSTSKKATAKKATAKKSTPQSGLRKKAPAKQASNKKVTE